MRAFYLSYEKVSQIVRQFEKLPIAQIPWSHNVILVTKIKNTEERLWYAHMTIEEGWTREALNDYNNHFLLFKKSNLNCLALLQTLQKDPIKKNGNKAMSN